MNELIWKSVWRAGCGLILGFGIGSFGWTKQERPNIIFIMSDDHAAKAISAYDGSINQTPHIDRLAAEGMLFRNAFVTNSICGPSRAVLLTGQHSHRNGMIANIAMGVAFDGSQQTFPKLMQGAGYETAVIGKWHLRSDPTGFDHWEVLAGQGSYYNPPMLTAEGRRQHTGYTTDIITDLSIEWLEERRDKSKPFVLLKHHKAPHRVWKPGPQHLALDSDSPIPEPPTLFDDYRGRSSASTYQEMEIGRHMHFYYDLKLPPREGIDLTPNGNLPAARSIYEQNMNEEQRTAFFKAYEAENEAFYTAYQAGMSERDVLRWKYQRYMKDYIRTIASVDDNIGRLLNYLDESGLAENTIVIYTSDQGFFLGERGWYDKRWHYDESLRMPLIVRWPGVTPPDSTNEDLVQNLDFAQTFLEAAGVQQPEEMQGRSLVPLLHSDSPDDWRHAIYFHYYEYPAAHSVHRHYGLRTERYKLAYFYELDEWEMFDLHRDPQELTSAYSNPFYADVVARLKAHLHAMRADYGDLHSESLPLAELREMGREEIRRVSLKGR